MKNYIPQTIFVFFIGLILWVCPIVAKISPLVNFQGYITDKSGMPVTDGEYDVRFSIYDGDDETASELWNEIQTVTVRNGFYTVSLGAVTAFKDPNRDTNESDALGFSKPYFLGIKVRKSGENSWDDIGFDARYLPLSSVWSAFRAKTSAGRLIAIKDENTEISDAEDMILVVGNTQITLSQALNAAGRMITVKKIDPKGTVVSIVTKNGETIDGVNYDPNDGADPFELTEKFQEMNLISDGRNWISTGTQLSFDSGNSGSSIGPQSINTNHLANEAVTTEKLADKSVTSEKLSFEDLTIPHENLELKHSVTNESVAPDAAIAYTKLQLENSIHRDDLMDRSVTAQKLDLGPGDLSYSMINLTGLIINADISENASIDYSKLNINGSLTNNDIADDASISHTKLDLSGISSEEFMGTAIISYKNLQLTDSIKDADISKTAGIAYTKLNLTNSITTTDIKKASVTYDKLNLNNGEIPYVCLSMNQSIIDSDIADNAQISYNKLNLQEQIATSDIQNNAITANKMAENAIRSINIIDKSLTSNDLANGSITPEKIYALQEGTSGQVLSTNGNGAFFWQTVSGGSGTIPDELPKLTVLGNSQLNTVSAHSATITQVSIGTHLSAQDASLLTLSATHAGIQSLAVGQTTMINTATSARSLTIPDLSGQLLISGHPMITATEISQKAIESQHIGIGAIKDTHIATNAQIPYAKLMLDSAIQGKDISNHTISYEKLSLADQSVPYTVLNLTGSIQISDLAAGSLGYSALDLNNTIQSKDIQDGTIQSQDIADQIILPQKLADIQDNGNLNDALMSDGGGGFYWATPSPFDAKISEIKYSALLGEGEIKTPTGIVITNNNITILAERSKNRIRLFDSEGQIYSAIIANGLVNSPEGMILDKNNHLLVVDRLHYCVKKFSINFENGTSEHIQTMGEGYLAQPYGIALDKNGKIYVTDTEHHAVVVLTASGSFDYTFGGKGALAGQFNTPYDIAIDRSGNIFVLDSDNNRVQKFDANRQFQAEFPKNKDLGTPYGIDIDDSGNVYVADTTNSRIQIYDNNGYYITTVQKSSNQFNPTQLVVDRAGQLYVSDTNNDRIQIFKPEDPIYTIRSTSVGIGTDNPYTSSALQIDSLKGGLLIPRMTDDNRKLIEHPETGLLVYQTDSHKGFYFFNGTEWINFDSNIYDNAVTESKIATDAVTTAKVKDNSLTGNDIQDLSLPVSKLAISGTPQDGHILVADGESLKWQANNQLSRILTVGDGGMFSTISDALLSITDNSETNRYLIKVGPGTFVEQISLKPYVDIEGSGENITIVRYDGGNTGPDENNSSATVSCATNCQVRFLSIVSESTANYAIGVYNSGASPSFTHVTIQAIGTNMNIGIYNAGNSLTLKNCTVSATGGTQNIGIQSIAAMKIDNSQIIATSAILHQGGEAEIAQGSIDADIQVTEGTMYLMGTMIKGAVITQGNGTASCAGVYGLNNGTLGFFPNTCPN
ncbi:MAG: NHL repeat containing protein [Candidatus Magnetoglobus multicellularis str. Araruama]|uniref:NHL repeat containing protein n=1 Tax=Candidatus Magnetoglobus multicellularis str. Araruama TaxID=890399 RepID=A0A1V1PE97_9BACT|nr:MAG: NHL repeat containing protein [Candidatus Magnetoglobus multicellularis str. Araruama]